MYLDMYMPLVIAQITNQTQDKRLIEGWHKLYQKINRIPEYVPYYQYGMFLLIYHRKTP